VASTDTGHKAKTGPFDFSFMRDEQAMLDFAYLANAEVAASRSRSSRSITGKRRRIHISRGARRAGARG